MLDENGNKSAYIGIYLQLDDTYQVVTRKVFNIYDAFAKVAVFMTVVIIAIGSLA